MSEAPAPAPAPAKERPAPARDKVEPVDRAAIFLFALGEEGASKVLKHLDPREVQRVGAAMAALGNVDMGQIATVLGNFLETVSGQSGLTIGSSDTIRRMLVSALGEDKARTLLDRILGGNTAGLDKLKWMDPRTIGEFIVHEHPQIQAIVLSYLEPDQAAEVLTFFPDAESMLRSSYAWRRWMKFRRRRCRSSMPYSRNR